MPPLLIVSVPPSVRFTVPVPVVAPVIVYDTMMSPIMRYSLMECQPASLEIGTLKAADTAVTTEKLTLHHIGIQIEKG